MLLNNFKVAGYKVFGEAVELKMNAESKNTLYLKENLIERKVNNKIVKNLKSTILYGSNNTGKSSLLEAFMAMKGIFKKGSTKGFPIEIVKNFSYFFDDVIRFEVDFNYKNKNIVYGFEFNNHDSIGEYVFINEELFFSKSLEGEFEGELFKNQNFKEIVNNLALDKLIVPYFLEYQKKENEIEEFVWIKTLFGKIAFIDNRRSEMNLNLFIDFKNNKNKQKIVNELIASTELFLEGRTVIDEEEFYKNKIYQDLINSNNFDKLNKTEEYKKGLKVFLDALRVTSIYKKKDGTLVNQPSIFFDSVGTNKFLNLAMNIINALLEGKILLIDEYDSSIHHKLSRVLIILMNSEANLNSQFIITSHDVNLIAPGLFRKDQVNFIVRDEEGVEVVSLGEYKANSNRDIRNTSNFETMYLEEKIVPLPNTNIYKVIKEIKNVI